MGFSVQLFFCHLPSQMRVIFYVSLFLIDKNIMGFLVFWFVFFFFLTVQGN